MSSRCVLFLGLTHCPLLLLMGWATPKQSAGIAAVFVLTNSAAALLGMWDRLSLPAQFPIWVAAVLIGAWLGAEIGSRKLGESIVCKALAAVLWLGGLKMILSALG